MRGLHFPQGDSELQLLRQHALIERLPRSPRYRVTSEEGSMDLLVRILDLVPFRPALAQLFHVCPNAHNFMLVNALIQIDQDLNDYIKTVIPGEGRLSGQFNENHALSATKFA